VTEKQLVSLDRCVACELCFVPAWSTDPETGVIKDCAWNEWADRLSRDLSVVQYITLCDWRQIRKTWETQKNERKAHLS
jgi:hypothetical protein